MKELKNIIIHIVVGLVVFVGALAFFNYHNLRSPGDAAAEMPNPSYPVLEIGNEISDYNLMMGYRDNIDRSLVRNQVTALDSSKEVHLKLHQYGHDITAIQYVLYQKSPDDPLEKGTLNKLTDEEDGDIREGTITLTSNLKEGASYYLQMAARLDDDTKIYYYTKIQSAVGYHVEEYFSFAKEFHENLFNEVEGMEANAIFLEPLENSTDNSLELVTINSSVDAVFVGSMEVSEETQPRMRLREINDTYAVVEVDSLLSSQIRSGVIQYYDMKETFKVRYTAERIYLLDYRRTMDARYNHEIIDSSENTISLGIQAQENVDYMSSAEGKKVAFAVQGQLWYYNYQSSDVSRVYSFSSENTGDLRNDPSDHGIKILKFNDDGNMTYLAYGYINRGAHEGQNGIQIMSYDAKSNSSTEIAFLSTSVPYETMRGDVEKFVYLNKNNVFYCILDGDLHQVDLKEKTDKILTSRLVEENLTASVDQSLIAVEASRNVAKNREINLYNLESGKKITFRCKKSQRIRSVGFLTNDFIYGVASADNVARNNGGTVTFPMARLEIKDPSGNQVKTYRKKGYYIMETEIKGNVLQMKLGKKKGSFFKTTSEEDFIRYKEEDTGDQVTLTYKYSTVYRNQLFLKFPNYVYIQIEPDLLMTRHSVNGKSSGINLEKSGDQAREYFVYAAGENKATYTSLAEAIRAADKARGNVIDNQEQTLWKCMFPSYAIVAGMDNVTKVSDDWKSLAGCLTMIGAVNGREIDTDKISGAEQSVEELVESCSGYPALNLTGCSTDEILYYISQGSPVLAKYSSSRYVIVMSYNSTKIRYLNPVTGKSIADDRGEVTRKLEKAGNVFYTYLME